MTIDHLTLPAPAKLNLFLHITGRRADGYHELQTLFQLLDFGDQLHLQRRSDNRLTLSPPLAGVTEQDNLIIRAARLLQQEAQQQERQTAPNSQTVLGCDIQLEKRLPMGGGIGGGSSDAATTLLGLNSLWQLGLSIDQLARLGAQLGADVPVFVRGKTAWAEGIGEQLTPLSTAAKHYLVLVPNCHVSTAEIFCHKDLTRDSLAIKVAAFFEQGSRNDCQPLVQRLYPAVDKALHWLTSASGREARMTGTGACVFAPFDSAAEAQSLLARALTELTDIQGFTAKGVNDSPLHSLLP